MNTEKLIKYSPNNVYAKDYYNAYNEFVKARRRVIDYEHRTNDRKSAKYQKLISKFLYWDRRVPEISKVAGREEKKIIAKQEEKQLEKDYMSSPFYINNHLDFFA